MSGIGSGAWYIYPHDTKAKMEFGVFSPCPRLQCASGTFACPSTVSINDARYKAERRVVGRGARRDGVWQVVSPRPTHGLSEV